MYETPHPTAPPPRGATDRTKQRHNIQYAVPYFLFPPSLTRAHTHTHTHTTYRQVDSSPAPDREFPIQPNPIQISLSPSHHPSLSLSFRERRQRRHSAELAAAGVLSPCVFLTIRSDSGGPGATCGAAAPQASSGREGFRFDLAADSLALEKKIAKHALA